MIYNYPFFGFPNYMNQTQKISSPIPDNVKNNKKAQNKKDQISPFISIMGINLFFDDILLICVILFLYNEEIDDYYLIIILILLLLS